jgi:multiple antibiotic resistance protein
MLVSQALGEVTTAFLLTFAALFPIVNPLESAPFFLDLTRMYDDAQRRLIAWQVTINSVALLLGSLILGPWILRVFGIELPVVRIAGGIVVVSVAWKLFHQETQTSGEQAVEAVSESARPASAFYPLTMPLTVGPGSISIATTLGTRKAGDDMALLPWLGHITGTCLGILAVGVSIFVCYAFSGGIMRRLGQTGSEIVVRLSAFILMCVGVQIIWSGYSALVLTAAK